MFQQRSKLAALATTFLVSLIATSLSVESASAQSGKLRKELREMEKDAKGDAGKLVEVAQWAKDKGLVRDQKRIAQSVLELDADNEPAHQLLGFEKFDGKWVESSKVAKLKQQKLADEMKAKGFVQVSGVWVTEKEKDDALKGIFWHEKQAVTRSEKLGFQQGKIRHPETGMLIADSDYAKAKAGQFHTSKGWVSLDKANEIHSNPQEPWRYRTSYAWVYANIPFAELKKACVDIDSAFEHGRKVFGKPLPRGAVPAIVLVKNDDEYRAAGTQAGADGSAYGAFIAEADVSLSDTHLGRPVFANFHKSWGPYFVRHAAGLAAAHAWSEATGTKFPEWFTRAVGGLVERHQNRYVASFFGKQHVQKGGVPDLSGWFSAFHISPDGANDALVYQAGLNLDFAMSGKSQDAMAAMQKLTSAFEAGSGVGDAIKGLETALAGSRDAMSEYLRKLTAE